MIVDSSPLIVFAKLNRIDLLLKLFKTIEMPKAVFTETVTEGLKVEAQDALLIKQYVEEKKIKVIELNKEFSEKAFALRKIYVPLSIGESEAISLSLQKKQKEVLIDEEIAREIAKLYGLKPMGSLRILLLGFNKKIVSEKEIRTLLQEMIKTKFRISAEVVNEFWLLFEKMKKK